MHFTPVQIFDQASYRLFIRIFFMNLCFVLPCQFNKQMQTTMYLSTLLRLKAVNTVFHNLM